MGSKDAHSPVGVAQGAERSAREKTLDIGHRDLPTSAPPMRVLWTYLKPLRALAALSLLLAGVSQVLTLIDPILFGRIIDQYARNPAQWSEHALLTGVGRLLLIAVAVAMAANLTRALQEYFTRMVVQRFGRDIFHDGLR